MNFPEDLPALHNMLDNILKKTKHSARIITDRYPEESMETEGHIIIAK